MQNHRYKLQPYKSLSDRYTCPSCNEKKKFTRYIDTQTSQQLADHCGRCERSDSCGYHYTPSDFFKENPDNKPKDFDKWAAVPAPPKREPSFIDETIFRQSLKWYYKNVFTQFLTSTFGVDAANIAIEKYKLGTANIAIKKYKLGTTIKGGTIFYQVDLEDKVRGGKIILYNIIDSLINASGKDCKRDKDITPFWVHNQKKLKLEGFTLSQCFFGEHLLTDKSKTVCIVESEKSAVISSIYQPQFIWLSCGGKDGLGTSKIQVLKDRSVILFPDLNGFNKWTEKAKEIAIIAKSVSVSPILEGIATDAERASGLDIADYLLRYPAPSHDLKAVALSQDKTQELVTYFLTDTKFLEYEGFTVDGIEIDSLPFDVGFHLGILANPTPDQINEALEFVELAKYLLDNKFYNTKSVTLSNGRTVYNLPFSLGYSFGLIDSEKESKAEHSVNILSLLKTLL